MRKKLPVMTKTVTIKCCEFERSGEYEHAVLPSLMRHIRRCHPELLQRIERAAIRIARRENGKGYYDVRGEGWKAERNKQWKEERREQALKEIMAR